MSDLSLFPITLLAILVAITIHECAHAYAAYKLGDDTARWAGRLTLNPLAHIDPLGAILFLLVGFGWAKPVPVDMRNLRHPVRDAALIALAGPLSNLILAFALAALGSVLPGGLLSATSATGLSAGDAVLHMLGAFILRSVQLNLALMAFNLLPVPPLDGSNILRLFIPWRLRDRYDQLLRYGPWILLAVILAESFLGIPILSAWVFSIMDAVLWVFSLVLP